MTVADLKVLAYELPRLNLNDNARIEAVYRRDGTRWWVVRRFDLRLSRQGEWDLERMPSEQQLGWVDAHSFKTPEEALTAWERAREETT